MNPNTGVLSDPDRIASGLNQPGTVKVVFTSERKELRTNVVLDKGMFGVEFYLTHTLPDFKSRIVDRIFPESQRVDGETLFPITELCLQSILRTVRLSGQIVWQTGCY